MIKIKEDLYFSSETRDMDLDAIFKFIKNSYWGGLREYEEQKIALENSINFGLFKNGKTNSLYKSDDRYDFFHLFVRCVCY